MVVLRYVMVDLRHVGLRYALVGLPRLDRFTHIYITQRHAKLVLRYVMVDIRHNGLRQRPETIYHVLDD